MKKEERQEIRVRMLAGESVEEILQDAKFQERTEEVQKTASRYKRISLMVKGMPYSEIARQELLAKGIENPDKKQIKAVCRSIAVSASIEKLVAPLKTKKEEVRRRLAEGQSVQEIVADRTLNVCQEAVNAWQEKSKPAPQKPKAPKKEPAVKLRKRLTEVEKDYVLTQIALGKSIEEICQMEQLKGVSQESIQRMCQENDWILPAIRLVDYAKIAQDTGRSRDNIWARTKQKSIQGEKITKIRARKRIQLQQRFQNRKEESLEEIAKELDIDLAAAQELSNQWEKTKQKREKKLHRRDEVMLVVEQMLLGKTPEEIGQMEQFQGYSFDSIREVCQAKAWMQDALKLVPYAKIAEDIGVQVVQVCKDGREFTIAGKSINQIRKEKENQIKQALQGETDVEKIATQFGVEVATVQEFIRARKPQTQEPRKISREEKEKLFEQFLAGKTPKEVGQMDEFQNVPIEGIERFYEEKSWMVLAIHLLPLDQVAEQTGRKIATVRSGSCTSTYQGRTIGQIRKEKKNQLKEGLTKGEKPVEILAQELDVDLEVARAMQKEIAQKQAKKVKKAPTVRAKKKKTKATQEKLELPRTEVKQPEKPQPKPEPIKPQVRPQEPTVIPAQGFASREERKQAVQKNSAYLRMRIMQGKYKSKQQGGGKQPKDAAQQKAGIVQSEKERLLIEKLLESIEARVAEAEKEMSKLERKPIMQAVYQEAKTLQQYALISEQAERFRKVMYGKAMDLYMHTCGPEPHERMARMQRVADRKMIGAIEAELEQTRDLPKLQVFSMQLNTIQGQNAFTKDRLSGIVYRKIEKIRREQAIYRLYYEVPQEVENIVAGIASGKIDVAETIEAIETLAEQRAAQNPAKGRMALTQAQQKRQIQMQIRATLSKQAERFPVERPEITLRLLREIGIQEKNLNLRAVIENQVARKKFIEAKAFCNVYGKTESEEGRKNIYGLRNEIRNAEIGDLVLRGIQGQVSPEGAAKFWETLEKGIRMGNVKLSQVILGKTADGTTDITLADVWPENQKQQNR